MGCVSTESCLHHSDFGKAEGRRGRIDPTLTGLWSWEVHRAIRTRSSPPRACRWEVLTRLLMTGRHVFAWVSTRAHTVVEWKVAGHWSMQNLSSKKKNSWSYLCCSLQSGAHRMPTQCSDWTPDLGPTCITTQFIQGKAQLILLVVTLCTAKVYLRAENSSSNLCQT